MDFTLYLKGNRKLVCACGRDTCGLMKRPPRLDAADAEKPWMPAAWSNSVKGSEFQKHRFRVSVPPEFGSLLEAAQSYVDAIVGGEVPRGVEFVDGHLK